MLPVAETVGISPFSFRHTLPLIEAARARTEAWLPAARPVPTAPTTGALGH